MAKYGRQPMRILSGMANEDLLDFLEEAIQDEEIYCPHEGIDKREDYYSSINLKGWNDWSAIAHRMV